MLERTQAHIFMNNINNISINQQVQMVATVDNYVLIPIKGNINLGDPQGIKIYLQEKKEIEKEYDKLDI